jgi:hypothetical protein
MKRAALLGSFGVTLPPTTPYPFHWNLP